MISILVLVKIQFLHDKICSSSLATTVGSYTENLADCKTSLSVFYSLFKDGIPHRDRQQAVNVVGHRAILDEEECNDRCSQAHKNPR